MIPNRLARIIFLIFCSQFIGGCAKDDQPDCAALKTMNDSAAKAELKKRCPRSGGPTFKPTPHKTY